jgi:excisionase family DNA binding protein
MLAGEKKLRNIRVKRLGGAIYTVDEVSGLLGIPRPTLYRYLREYSIPHLRQAGRISIPEDSFDRIREARDLHKEGLGTESVRRQLREGSTPDTGDLDRRLDNLHSTLEDLRADIKERPASEEMALSPTVRTILARQSLLMSAMFNLTEMVEDLLLASGKPRKPPLVDIGTAEIMPEMPERRARDLVEIQRHASLSTATLVGTDDVGVERTIEAGSADFGTLRRRRRRGVLAILVVLLFAVVLAWMMPKGLGGSGTESAIPRVKETAGEPPGIQKAVAATGSSRSEGAEVPDISGQSLGEAIESISDAGFEVTDVRTEASPRDPDTAIRTKPTAGVPAEPGANVVLTMSGGPTVTPSSSASASATATATATATTIASAAAGDAN